MEEFDESRPHVRFWKDNNISNDYIIIGRRHCKETSTDSDDDEYEER